MSFTYNLATDIGKVRLEIGDVTSGKGVRSDASNLNDEEIQVLLDREGSVMRATAAACELLARNWAAAADVVTGGGTEIYSRVSDHWAALGKTLRAQYGGAATTFSAGWARTDGYHEEAEHDTEYLSEIVYIKV